MQQFPLEYKNNRDSQDVQDKILKIYYKKSFNFICYPGNPGNPCYFLSCRLVYPTYPVMFILSGNRWPKWQKSS